MKRIFLGLLMAFALLLAGCGGGGGGDDDLDQTSKDINTKLGASSDADTVSSEAKDAAEAKANEGGMISSSRIAANLVSKNFILKSTSPADIKWTLHDDGWYYATNVPSGMVYKYRQDGSTIKFHGERTSTDTITPPAYGEDGPLYAEGTLAFQGSFNFTATLNSDNTWSGTQESNYRDDSKGTTYANNTKPLPAVGGWDDVYTGSSTLTITNGNLTDGTGTYAYTGTISYTDKLDGSRSKTDKTVTGTFTITKNGASRLLSGRISYDGGTPVDISTTID